MMEFNCIRKADNLPPGWDKLADNYFQQKQFLSHAENYNACGQRYYSCNADGKIKSGAIVYTLRLDILTFSKITSPFKMQIVGIPCSVSSPGIFGENQAVEALKKYIYEVEKGFILVLNLDTKPLNGSSASGNTLPAIVLSNHYAGWDDYMSSLRTGYRRRLKRLNLPAEELSFEKKHCSAFTPEMYLQYLEVYKRSQGKLEKLSFEFFRQLPAEFMLTLCLRKRRVIGWNIALLNQHRYYFFLGGIDYNLNKTYKTYLSLLSALVKDGIESKADSIDLGQTAEIPKMRMGGQIVPLYMEARHSNFIVNYLLRIFSPLLEYQRKPETSHPVKQEIR